MFQKSLLGLLVLGVIFFFIEKIVGFARRQFWQSSGWLTDVVFFFLAPGVKFLGKFLVVVPGLILIAMGLIERRAFGSGDYHGYGPVSRQPLWCQFIEIYVLADFIGYWMHRWFHAPTLWPFHAVHHSSEELDWLASVRVHPVNEWANALVHVTPLLLLGFNPHAALSVAPFLTFYRCGIFFLALITCPPTVGRRILGYRMRCLSHSGGKSGLPLLGNARRRSLSLPRKRPEKKRANRLQSVGFL
jgi:sterol desaturase/sphingolipid hydroxylase (fatty acid hydroxylase superfamily)